MKTNVIYPIDCISGMEHLLAEDSVDVIVTSPPYNIGMVYDTYEDNLPYQEYLDWMEEFGEACARVLKPTGSLFFNIGDKPSDTFRSFEVAQQISKFLQLQNTIHWIKAIASAEHGVNVGHYKPVNSKRFLNNVQEYIFHFTPGGDAALDKLSIGVPYGHKSNLTRWNEKKDTRDRGNAWLIPYETVQSPKDHPAAFPKLLPMMCIKLHGFNNETVVLDPFCGSGTTCVAARELGCKWIGFETDAGYSERAEEQLSAGSLF